MKQQQQQQGAKQQSLTDYSEAFLYQKIEMMEKELTNDNSFRWKTTIIKNKEMYEPSFWDSNLILTIILAGFLLVVFLCISKSSSSVPMNNNNNTFVRGSTNEDLSNKLIRLGSTNNTTTTNANATDAISVLENSNTTTTTTTTVLIMNRRQCLTIHRIYLKRRNTIPWRHPSFRRNVQSHDALSRHGCVLTNQTNVPTGYHGRSRDPRIGYGQSRYVVQRFPLVRIQMVTVDDRRTTTTHQVNTSSSVSVVHTALDDQRSTGMRHGLYHLPTSRRML
mmetsp:Transcript_32180/g.47540  ORF Transcript_32180/g.47540 Transcript_32180/m.47540 type:complete len:278 (-) Transcript_32180:521-1354(-)